MGILDLFRRELTQDRFADIVLKRMARSADRFRQAAYDASLFCIRFRDARGTQNTFNLHNVYADYKKAQRGRSEILDKYLLAFGGAPDELDRDTILKNLMPVIRDRAMFEQAALIGRLSNGVDAPAVITPTTPFLGHLVIALVIDSEHATASLSQKKLEELGLDFDAALGVAMNNLRDRTEQNFRTNGKGVFISAWHDVYDASRLLLTDMLYRLPINGDPVVAIPSRNDLLVTGSRDEHGIAELASLTVHVLENDTRPLAEQLFQYRDGAWHLFEGRVPEQQRLGKAGYIRRMRAYEDQKQHLTKIYEKEKFDVFVASYRVYDNPQLGGLISSAQWTRDVVTLLPVADYLWFYCPIEKEITSVTWDKAKEIITLPAAEPSLHPERFLVRGFPSAEQLHALKQSAVSIWKVGEADSAK